MTCQSPDDLSRSTYTVQLPPYVTYIKEPSNEMDVYRGRSLFLPPLSFQHYVGSPSVQVYYWASFLCAQTLTKRSFPGICEGCSLFGIQPICMNAGQCFFKWAPSLTLLRFPRLCYFWNIDLEWPRVVAGAQADTANQKAQLTNECKY